ncbi:MAG: DUF4411 family protein [Alphaproteobacteria bacterium]|nr:MAG: DUF4411 family protein [Alphaproteobacteria bacterium]
MYLLDSNVFIEAANRYYAFDICPGFWDWLDQVCPGRDVFSIEPVYRELADKSDELAAWVKGRRDADRFLPVDDEATQNHFAGIARTIQAGPAQNAAKQKFLAGADPWLVAKALTAGATVVTHERPLAANATRRISLANLCQQHEISYIDSFALLRKFEAQFHY